MSYQDQRSPDWTAWRRDKIGGSDSPILMGLSPWCSPETLLRRKLGLEPEQYLSPAMQRGQELEKEALEAYQYQVEKLMFPVVKTHPAWDWCIASLDGISLDETQIVEIKVPGKKTVDMAANGEIPPNYLCQMQHQRFVCELDKCDYFCYDGHRGHLISVDRDEEFIAEMLTKELEFMEILRKGLTDER